MMQAVITKSDNSLQGVRVLHLAAADSMLNPNLREQLLFLRRSGCDVHTASIDGPLGRRLHEEDGFPWTPLPITREFAPLSDLRAVRFIERLCRRDKYDIVHTHTPKGNLVGQWGAKLGGTRLVLQTLHGFYFHDRMPALQRRAWIEIERFAANLSDHILCQNPEDVETAIREGIVSKSRITELGNGIDLERFKPVSATQKIEFKRRLGLPVNARVIGMVGRFVREKGFEDFIAAAQIVVKDYSDVHFLCVGHQLSSERSSEPFDFQTIHGLKDRLSILTDRNDMPEIYASMDIHVLPSYREGFPRSLIEGAACGLPQIATNIRGCRQVVINGRNGGLFEPGDTQILAELMKNYLDDADLREKLGLNSLNQARENFNQSGVFQRLKACYERLLNE